MGVCVRHVRISAELAVARREVDRLQKDLESVESANARLVEERDEKEARVQALKKRVEVRFTRSFFSSSTLHRLYLFFFLFRRRLERKKLVSAF